MQRMQALVRVSLRSGFDVFFSYDFVFVVLLERTGVYLLFRGIGELVLPTAVVAFLDSAIVPQVFDCVHVRVLESGYRFIVYTTY